MTHVFADALALNAGYFLLWAAANWFNTIPSYVLGLFSFTLGQGSCWIYSVALKINTQNFRAKDRGKVRMMLY